MAGIEQGTSGGGGRMSYAFLDDDQLHQYAKEAVDQALINLEADEAPAGEMTVVLGSGWPGVLICLLYTSPSPRDMRRSRMPSSA